MMQNIEKIQAVFERVFNIQSQIEPATSKDNLPEWDSFGHLSLIVDLEEEFDISFTKDQIERIRSVEEILQILEKNENE